MAIRVHVHPEDTGSVGLIYGDKCQLIEHTDVPSRDGVWSGWCLG